MVVLVSFLLVLAAAVTLVVGLLQSGLTLIYLSIGCSVVAGLVLAVAVLRGRPEPKAAPYAAPPRPVSTPTPTPVPSYSSRFESEPEPDDEPWKVDTTPPPAARRFGRPAAVAIEESDDEPSPIAGYARRAAGAGASTAPMAIRNEMPEALPPGGDFPIADFDSLRAPELLRRVDELTDVASLEAVREAEAAGKNRVSILSRIDARLETLREPGWDIDEAAWEGDEPAAAAADDLDAGDDFDAGAGGDFPIDNYDSLRVGQILPQLRELDDGQLADVRAYEAAGKARSGILDRIDSLSSGGPPAAAAAPAAAAPAEPAAGGRSSIAAAVAAAKAKQAEKG